MLSVLWYFLDNLCLSVGTTNDLISLFLGGSSDSSDTTTEYFFSEYKTVQTVQDIALS